MFIKASVLVVYIHYGVWRLEGLKAINSEAYMFIGYLGQICANRTANSIKTKTKISEIYTSNTSGHVAGDVSCDQWSQYDQCEVLPTRRSHGAKRSQLDAHPADASEAAKHVCRYQLRTLLTVQVNALYTETSVRIRRSSLGSYTSKKIFQIEAVRHLVQQIR